MPSDEELRRVAEDLRSLARSLARDIHEASRTAQGSTRSATAAFRQGVKEAAQEASAELEREIRKEFGRRYEHYRGHPPRWVTGRDQTRPHPSPPGGQSDPTATGGDPPPAGPSRSGPPRPAHHHRSREPRRNRLRPTRPPVRRRWDGPLVAALVAVVLGGAWLLSAVGVVAVSAETALALALMLLGAAVVVSARSDWSLSRHGWPVLVGLVLIVGLFATSSTYGLGRAFAHMSVGHRTVTASTSGSVYGGLGQLTVDASGAQPGSQIEIRSLAGSTVIDPPKTTPYIVEGRVLAGHICVGSQSASGVGASETVASGNSHGAVIFDVRQLAGQVQVEGSHCGGDR